MNRLAVAGTAMAGWHTKPLADVPSAAKRVIFGREQYIATAPLRHACGAKQYLPAIEMHRIPMARFSESGIFETRC